MALYTYQWQRDNLGNTPFSNIASATASTYVLVAADTGCHVRCAVTATNDTSAVTVDSNSVGLITATGNPVNTALPGLNANVVVGQTQTCTTGTWTGNVTGYTYQWQRDNHGGGTYSNISGATTSSYILTNTDDGCQLRCVVTATNANGSTAANSTSVTVKEPLPVNTAAPVASGTPTQGDVFSVMNGTWSNMAGYNGAYAYQWQRDGSGNGVYSNISGSTAGSYTTALIDRGCNIRAVVTATNTGGVVTANSNSLGPVVAPAIPANTVAPAITGTATVTHTLTVSTGSWTNTPTSYAYQWQRDDMGSGLPNAIAGATASTYVLQGADDGSHITCTVTGINANGSGLANSNQVGIILQPSAPVNLSAPFLLTPSPIVGLACTVAVGTWLYMNGTGTYSYQWQRNDNVGGGWINITGQTYSVYTPQLSDVGASLLCQVTATNDA